MFSHFTFHATAWLYLWYNKKLLLETLWSRTKLYPCKRITGLTTKKPKLVTSFSCNNNYYLGINEILTILSFFLSSKHFGLLKDLFMKEQNKARDFNIHKNKFQHEHWRPKETLLIKTNSNFQQNTCLLYY